MVLANTPWQKTKWNMLGISGMVSNMGKGSCINYTQDRILIMDRKSRIRFCYMKETGSTVRKMDMANTTMILNNLKLIFMQDYGKMTTSMESTIKSMGHTIQGILIETHYSMYI